MKTAYLVRHGQKQADPGDPGLTELGMQQSLQTGEYLSQLGIEKIVTSPYKRTVETAAAISSKTGFTPVTDERLIERMNWRDGLLTREQFLQEWVKATQDRDFTSAYGDSSRRTGQRVELAIEAFLQNNSQTVFVTHGGAILDYLRNVFGEKQVEHLRKEYEAGFDFQMYNCSITQVVFDPNPNLVTVNFTDHLSDLTE